MTTFWAPTQEYPCRQVGATTGPQMRRTKLLSSRPASRACWDSRRRRSMECGARPSEYGGSCRGSSTSCVLAALSSFMYVLLSSCFSRFNLNLRSTATRSALLRLLFWVIVWPPSMFPLWRRGRGTVLHQGVLVLKALSSTFVMVMLCRCRSSGCFLGL